MGFDRDDSGDQRDVDDIIRATPGIKVHIENGHRFHSNQLGRFFRSVAFLEDQKRMESATSCKVDFNST